MDHFFKIGDKVRRINFSNKGVVVGQVYKIKGFNGTCGIRLEGRDFAYLHRNFEPVPEPAEFKVGDVLKVDNTLTVPAGALCVVIKSIDETTGWLRVVWIARDQFSNHRQADGLYSPDRFSLATSDEFKVIAPPRPLMVGDYVKYVKEGSLGDYSSIYEILAIYRNSFFVKSSKSKFCVCLSSDNIKPENRCDQYGNPIYKKEVNT